MNEAPPAAQPKKVKPLRLSDWDSTRLSLAGISILVAIGVIILLNVVSMISDGFARNLGRLLVDYQLPIKRLGESGGPNIFAPQNLMWVAFFFGLAELFYRRGWVKKEALELDRGYLPSDERTLLSKEDLPAIYRYTRQADRRLYLPRLIQRIVIQFQKSDSVEQSASLLNSSLELFHHEVDLRYTVVRYTNWVIPTLGFLGTVIGIANALSFVGAQPGAAQDLLQATTLKLGVAFYTTLLALVLSGILVLVTSLVESTEERVLNLTGQYCLDNLINKLIEKK